MSKKYWATFSMGLEFQLPEDAVRQCHHPGPCDLDVEYWQRELALGLNRAAMLRELREYGAWDADELAALDNDELEQKLIWLAAGDIQESEEWQEAGG